MAKASFKSFIRHHKVALLSGGLVAVGLIARFCFLFFTYSPVSDPANFFYGAQSLLESGSLPDPGYFALFPYLLPYTSLLTGAMRLFGDGLLAITILNTLFDLLNAFLFGWLYLRLSGRRFGDRSKVRNRLTFHPLASALYFIFPVHVIFSALSLPVIVVNTFILLTVVMAYLLYRNRKSRAFFGFALLSGLILALGNLFRPFMAVGIIALLLLLTTWFLARHIGWRRALFGAALIIVPFLLFSRLTTAVFTRTLGEPAASSSGWSVFVGANAETRGEWNTTDYAELVALRGQGLSAPEIHNIFMQRGLERWRVRSLGSNLNLLAHKAVILGLEPTKNTYNLNSYPELTDTALLGGLLELSSWFAIGGVIIWLFSRCRPRSSPVFFICLFALLGLLAALLLVEVSPRYFLPLWPLLLLVSGLGYYNSLKKRKPMLQ